MAKLSFKSKTWERFGQLLFRYRAGIAVPFFILLVFLSRSSPYLILWLALWVAGIGLRIWASGYIGPEARGNRFSSQYRIVNGPYGILKHPLYFGNFLLILGAILLYNPPFFYSLLLVILFLLEYSIIIYAENKYVYRLKKKVKQFRVANIKGEITTIIVLAFIFTIYLFTHIDSKQP